MAMRHSTALNDYSLIRKGCGLLLLLGLLAGSGAHAQIPVQLFAGHNAVEFDFIWQKNIDQNGKFSLLNFTFFSLDYDNAGNNAYEINQTAVYKFHPNWGLASGGRFVNDEFLPQIALSYELATGDLYFNVFPAVQYVPSLREAGYSVLGFLFYTPEIDETWHLFTQLIFEPFFSRRGHIYSFQQIRLGLDYNARFQFGLGANLEQIGSEFHFTQNYGLFIRKELH
jgi:hypothetical protein